MMIDFYYWADQCPHNAILRTLLTSFRDDEAYQTTFHDISNDPELAEALHIYSPTLLIFDGKLRWNGPISRKVIASIVQGKMPRRPPYQVVLGERVITGFFKPLTENTVRDTTYACAPSGASSCCDEKAKWMKRLRETFHLPHLGYLHYMHTQCVGGAEFVPSIAVPYPIPKQADSAFLTCSFLSDEFGDYRTAPLQKLEAVLPQLGFHRLLAIASEEVVFPNGPLEWFLKRGYADVGEVYHEEREFARMHLVQKEL